MTPAQIAKAARSRNNAGEALLEVMRQPAAKRAALLTELDSEARAAWSERLAERPHLWEPHYRAVLADLLPLPETPAFALGMMDGIRHPASGPWNIAARLRACPDLLQRVVWRLFEIGSVRGKSLAGQGRGWEEAMLKLAGTGDLDRARLLDASLSALGRGFSRHESGWFARFHESLSPTADERTARAGIYVGLLASPHAPTVTFALSALKPLPMNGDIATWLVGHCSAALYSGSKGAAKALLKLLDQAANFDPALRSTVARRAAEALHQPDADVQSAAWSLVSKHGEAGDAELVAAVRQALPRVVPSLKTEIAKHGFGMREAVVDEEADVAVRTAPVADASRPCTDDPLGLEEAQEKYV